MTSKRLIRKDEGTHRDYIPKKTTTSTMKTQSKESDLLDNPTNTRRHSVPGLDGVKYATEAPYGEAASASITSKHFKTSIREHQRIAAWNVRGLLKPGKLCIVEKEMVSHKINILAISETHLQGYGHYKTSMGNTFYFSGSDNSSSNGVGILVPDRLNGYVLGYNPVSDRIVTMKLNTKPCTLNIVSIYAPTSQSSEEEIETFYGKLEETLDSIPNREITMILGDWNAKVGNTTADEHLRETVGHYGLGSRNERVVRIDEMMSQPFKFCKGVRQGCILSPILFNAYGEYIMRHTCDQWEGGVRIGGVKLNNLRYADDTTLLAADEAEMCTLLERMERVSINLGLSINKDKTKIMVMDRSHTLGFTGALNLHFVEEFVYLGSTITNNGSCELDVRRRIGMAKSAMSQLHKTWKDRNISLRTKIKLVRTLVFSILLYGAETWTLKSADRKRIDAFKMWCWRKMLRIPWTAFRTNASILAQLKVKIRLSTICLKRILEYFGHIARKDGDNLEKLVITGKVEGKRSRGRSPMRWSDQVRTTLESTVYDALRVAGDRKEWHTILKTRIRDGGGHDPHT
ncbi:uncharacterized protein LOC128199289 [Bicyclus anynana]|uniref:Uncharacterized protein LOC128199289 n=1 Tax=Bicyclus anynana TaxID=110368 RepID=A0ABM3LYM2_BICAN|nr:uncharacterized protein LOC128199289 [Bicyclus anynana]